MWKIFLILDLCHKIPHFLRLFTWGAHTRQAPPVKKGLSLSEAYIFNKTRARPSSLLLLVSLSLPPVGFSTRAPLSHVIFSRLLHGLRVLGRIGVIELTGSFLWTARLYAQKADARWLGQQRGPNDRARGCPPGGFFQPFQCAAPRGILVPRQGHAAVFGVESEIFMPPQVHDLDSQSSRLSPACVPGVVLKLEATRVTWCQLSHSSFILIPRMPHVENETRLVNHIFCLPEILRNLLRATFLTMHIDVKKWCTWKFSVFVHVEKNNMDNKKKL